MEKSKDEQAAHEEEEEKSVYVFFKGYGGGIGDLRYSKINTSVDNNHSVINIPTLNKAPQSESSESMVALDRKLYLLECTLHPVSRIQSSLNDPSREMCRGVYCLDTRTKKGGWKRCSSMLSGRFSSPAIALDGRIYVFGTRYYGSGNHTPDPWGEVYDPIADAWSALPPPPLQQDILTKQCRHLIEYKSNMILVAMSDDQGLLYDTRGKRWELITENIISTLKTSCSAVVDGVRYSFDRRLYGCDLATGEGFRVEGLETFFKMVPNERYHKPAFVFYVGNGKLVLIGEGRCLTCVKFRVIRYYDSEGRSYAHARLEASAAYTIDDFKHTRMHPLLCQ